MGANGAGKTTLFNVITGHLAPSGGQIFLNETLLTGLPAQELTLAGQKKLELARAICTGSQVLLLDEVMAGLTPPEVAEMLGVIARLHQARGLTILIIEHATSSLDKRNSPF